MSACLFPFNLREKKSFVEDSFVSEGLDEESSDEFDILLFQTTSNVSSSSCPSVSGQAHKLFRGFVTEICLKTGTFITLSCDRQSHIFV